MTLLERSVCCKVNASSADARGSAVFLCAIGWMVVMP
jgi:hypothetical protein